jgi:transcription antitermination factor NusG
MPILRKEIALFPEDLFDIPTEEAPWEIAHLRSRQEKTVARLLHETQKPFYLPQIEQTKKSSGRTFVSHLPLFPGYIFVRRVDGLRETLWRTNAVVNMLEVPDQAQLTAELLLIRKLQEIGAVVTPQIELVPGDAVQIEDGVFAGYHGIVIEERGAMRLIVGVTILKSSVSVEFPREILTQSKKPESQPTSSRDAKRST